MTWPEVVSRLRMRLMRVKQRLVWEQKRRKFRGKARSSPARHELLGPRGSLFSPAPSRPSSRTYNVLTPSRTPNARDAKKARPGTPGSENRGAHQAGVPLEDDDAGNGSDDDDSDDDSDLVPSLRDRLLKRGAILRFR